MESKWYHKYIIYKTKYLKLKNSNIMIGGNNQSHLHTLLKDNNIKELIHYIIKHDIPIMLLPIQDEETLDYINIDKYELLLDEIEDLYEVRKKIYTIDSSNIDEVLDYIIDYFNIKNEHDIIKLFNSTILGYKMNYIIYYMVLFRYLIKNNKQLSVSYNNVPYLSSYSLQTFLNMSNNMEEYLPLILKLIKDYMFSVPIKKVLQIKKEEINWHANKRLLKLNKIDPDYMVSFDAKNNIFIYTSGMIKDSNNISFNDLIQVLYNLFRIPIFNMT